MKTTFEKTEESAKISSSNTWAGFWFLVFFTSLIVASWGEPDLIDAQIYYHSEGHYK